MTFTPPPPLLPRRVFAGSPEGLGIPIGAMAVSHGAQAWGTSNMARYVPIMVTQPTPLTKFFWPMNTAANVDVGIYTATGTRIVSAGSTAGAGLATYQEFNVTDTTLEPGRYYLAANIDNGAGQAGGFLFTTELCRALGCYEEAAAFPLPATATFAAPTSNLIPSVGFNVDVTA